VKELRYAAQVEAIGGVRDSIVQRSAIGADVRKCPNCGGVVGDERFCVQCEVGL
jgi:hypothetical protein